MFKTQKPNHIKKKYFQDSCKSWSNLYLAKVPLKRIPSAQNIIDLKINDKKSIKECSRLELNQRPLDFQSNALPLSYLSFIHFFYYNIYVNIIMKHCLINKLKKHY